MVLSYGDLNNFSALILNITKARVVKINKDKYKRRMNRLGKMFRLYWMGKNPSNYRKDITIGSIQNVLRRSDVVK